MRRRDKRLRPNAAVSKRKRPLRCVLPKKLKDSGLKKKNAFGRRRMKDAAKKKTNGVLRRKPKQKSRDLPLKRRND